MSKSTSGFSPFQLRLLFRLMPESERAVALNLRSHNPVDVKMVIDVQTYVDGALGIQGSAFFKSDDEVRVAALKGIRNVLASRAKKRWISRWFFTEADGRTLEYLHAYLEGLYVSPNVRLLRAAGLSTFVVLVSFLFAKRLKRWAEVVDGSLLECRNVLTRGFMSERKASGEKTSPDAAEAKRPTVVVLTSLFHSTINFTVQCIVDELKRKKTDVVLALHDGYPEKLQADGNRRWCAGANYVALENNRSSLFCWMSLIVAPRVIFPVISSIGFALRRVLHAKTGDWGMKWLLLRKIPVLIAGFHISLLSAEKLLSRFKPVSVLNCDNGSENLLVKAFAYQCARMRIPFYRYRSVATFPVRQPAFSSVENIMLATPEDERLYAQPGAAWKFWNVGSPLLDLAASFVSRKKGENHRQEAGETGRVRILFFTKRDFPNRGVISAVTESCVKSRRPAYLTVKFHPSDSGQFASGPSEHNGLVKILYYGREEIEHVDRLISEADIVISGSSNVIWSAFAQFKPVVYLGFRGMSSDGHVSGYGRYATSEFVVASELKEVGDIVGRLIDKIRKGEASRHFDRHDSLMRNFFCSGKFNSKERICRVLMGAA